MKGVAGGTSNFFLDALPDEAFCRLVALPPPRFVELLASSRNVFGWCGQVGGRGRAGQGQGYSPAQETRPAFGTGWKWAW